MLCDRGCLLMSGDGKKQACQEGLRRDTQGNSFCSAGPMAFSTSQLKPAEKNATSCWLQSAFPVINESLQFVSKRVQMFT